MTTTNTETDRTANLMIIATRVAAAINARGPMVAREDGKGGYVRVVACQTGVRCFGLRDSGLECVVDILRVSSSKERNLVKVARFAGQTYGCARFEARMGAIVQGLLESGTLTADGTDIIIR